MSSTSSSPIQQDREFTVVASAPPPPPRSIRTSSGGGSPAQERLDAYTQRSTVSRNVQKEQRAHEDARLRPDKLVPLLTNQVYHLPGNSWWQDWRQYMMNNHIFFGIFCHHPQHPLKKCTRLVALLGSFVFGLALTNIFYLLFIYNEALDQPVATFVVHGDNTSSDSASSFQAAGDDGRKTVAADDTAYTYSLTTGMLLLWTVGGGIHTMYNLMVWHVAACACCRPGGCFARCALCPSFGKRMVRILVLIIIVLTILVILMRVAIAEEQDAARSQVEYGLGGSSGQQLKYYDSNNSSVTNNTDTNVEGNDDNAFFQVPANALSSDTINAVIREDGVQRLDFIWSYVIEMILALFLYHPIGGTILFSGVLGCGGKLPGLGGRPREVALEEQARKKQLERELRKQRRQQQRHPRRRQRIARPACPQCSSVATSTTPTTVSSLDLAEQGGLGGNHTDNFDPGEIEIVWSRQARQDFQR